VWFLPVLGRRDKRYFYGYEIWTYIREINQLRKFFSASELLCLLQGLIQDIIRLELIVL